MVVKKRFYFLPLIMVDKGLVEEKDLRIKYEGIMTARSKALTIVEPIDAQ
jgi:electron transfer flavoprotein beta subunit